MKKNSKQPAMKNNASDNFQTPARALDCIAPHLKAGSRIWECACGKGNLSNGLDERGFYVHATDIIFGFDFLRDDYSHIQFDAIVTNPPFSIKDEWIARCYEIGKPFALLLPMSSFDSEYRRGLFEKHGVEIVLPNGRFHFETPNHEKNIATGKKSSSWFYTAWFTHGLNIGKTLTFYKEDAANADNIRNKKRRGKGV